MSNTNQLLVFVGFRGGFVRRHFIVVAKITIQNPQSFEKYMFPHGCLFGAFPKMHEAAIFGGGKNAYGWIQKYTSAEPCFSTRYAGFFEIRF